MPSGPASRYPSVYSTSNVPVTVAAIRNILAWATGTVATQYGNQNDCQNANANNVWAYGACYVNSVVLFTALSPSLSAGDLSTVLNQEWPIWAESTYGGRSRGGRRRCNRVADAALRRPSPLFLSLSLSP